MPPPYIFFLIPIILCQGEVIQGIALEVEEVAGEACLAGEEQVAEGIFEMIEKEVKQAKEEVFTGMYCYCDFSCANQPYFTKIIRFKLSYFVIRGSFYHNQRGSTNESRGGRGGYRNDRGSGRGGQDRGASSNRGNRSANTAHTEGNDSQLVTHRPTSSGDATRER